MSLQIMDSTKENQVVQDGMSAPGSRPSSCVTQIDPSTVEGNISNTMQTDRQPSVERQPEDNAGGEKEPGGSTEDHMDGAAAIMSAVQIKQEPVDTGYNVSSVGSSSCHHRSPSHLAVAKPDRMVSVGRQRYYAVGRINYVPDMYVCEVCQAELSSPKVLNLHKLCHFNTSHVCYVCDCYFQTPNTMVVHMTTQHSDLNPASQSIADGLECLLCAICLQRFANKLTLQRHQINHLTGDDNNFKCRMCGLDFAALRALVAHLSSSHHTEMKVKLQGIFVCVDCRSIFATRDAYAMHMMMRAQNETCKGIGTDIKPTVQAKIETRTFTPEEQIEKLNMVNSPSANLIISASNSATTSPLNLTKSACSTPLSSHPARSPLMPPPSHHTCNKCLSSFSSQDALALHMMMHTRTGSLPDVGHQQTGFSTSPIGNRPNSAPIISNNTPIPWMCGRCLISFDTCDSLAMHMMTKHANEAMAEAAALSALQENKQGFDGNIAELLKQAQQVELGDTDKGIIDNLSSDNQSETDIRAAGHDDNKEDLGPEPKRRKCYVPRRKGWDCAQCDQSFATKLEWSFHLQKCSHTKCAPPRCEVCHMMFLNVQALDIHLRSPDHHQLLDQQRVCAICSFMATDHQALVNHIKTVHNITATAPEFQTENVPGQDWQAPDENDGMNLDLNYVEKGPDSPNVVSEETTSGKEPLNLICNLKPPEQLGRMVPGMMQSQKMASLSSDTEDSILSASQSGSQIPESSTCQDGWGKHQHACTPLSGMVSQSGIAASEDDNENDVVDYVLSHVQDLAMCKYCKVIYTDRTVYYLHMGLHNLNNPWQCNMCGKVCQDLHEFSSHVIHY